MSSNIELTDVSEMERLFNWEDYVKNVIELQEHAGVLRAIGVAIDEGKNRYFRSVIRILIVFLLNKNNLNTW